MRPIADPNGNSRLRATPRCCGSKTRAPERASARRSQSRTATGIIPVQRHHRSDDAAAGDGRTPVEAGCCVLLSGHREQRPTTALGSLAALVLLLFLAPSVFAASAEWPQFRGLQAGGVAEGFKTPERWNVETGGNIRWQTPLPGLAHSCPIIWGDRVFVTTAAKDGEATLKVGLYGDVVSVDEPVAHRWMLLCLDKASGKVLWQTNAHEAVPRIKRHPKGSHCSSTPATDGQRIVAILGSEGLFCFGTNGSLLWKK